MIVTAASSGSGARVCEVERVAGHGQDDEGADDDHRQREEDHQQQVDQADGHLRGIGHIDEAVGQLHADAGLADLHVLAGLAPGERRNGHLALARDDDRAIARANRGDLANRLAQRADAIGAEHPPIHVGDVQGRAAHQQAMLWGGGHSRKTRSAALSRCRTPG